jgi:hypothetical protein
MRFRELRYGADPQCPGCGASETESALPDTRAPFCAIG